MSRNRAELAMALVGITSVALLVLYGMMATGGNGQTDALFWVLTAAFVVCIAWDVRRHLRNIQTR